MARECKYGCKTLLGDFDEEQHKYLEAGTGGLHTKERCQEAKLKLEQKNDHGNELEESPKQMYERLADLPKTEYVDHTLKGQSKVKIFSSVDKNNLAEEYNDFLAKNNGKIKTQGAQFQMATSPVGFAIALYYEEVKA